MNSPFEIILIIALYDALAGGALAAWMQRRNEWNQTISDLYQVFSFLAVACYILFTVEIETAVQVGILWLGFVEDLLYFWIMPLLRPLHVAIIGQSQHVTVIGDFPLRMEVPMFYIRDTYRGPVGFVISFQFKRQFVCIVALLTSAAVWFI